MRRIRSSSIVFLAAVLSTSIADAKAMRIVGISISLDGKHILGGMHGDNGSVPEAAVWRYLSFVQLKPHDGAVITADADNPLKATLKGKVHIDVSYGGKANVEELQLVRSSPTSEWTVAEDDVERIAKDIGLGTIPPPPPPAVPQSAPVATVAPKWIWLTGGGMIVALLIALVLLRRGSGGE